MSLISVSLVGGENTSVPEGSSIQDVLQVLVSGKQRKQTLAAFCNGVARDLSTHLHEDTVLDLIRIGSDKGLEILRHSTAHIMAQAVKDLFGQEVKVAIGPAIDDGYYYDFDRSTAFTPDDFPAIEEQMAAIVQAALPFQRQEMPTTKAIEFFTQQGENYKVALLQDMAAEGIDSVSLYQQGAFIDLCRGPHLPDTSWLQCFKLLRVAGSYWRGDEKNPMLTRIYGTAFFDHKELKAHLERIEEAKRRDHRRLGKELKLFTIQDEVGPGLILWQPRGALLRKLIEDYWKEAHYRHGYHLLYTPHIARQDLWKTSGHLDFYAENMYSAMDIDEVAYQLKPMNCPFHIGVYRAEPHSYREFPIRWCELGTVYRYERTGALHGLMRVRGFTQDDAHIFCRPDQLEEEIFNIIDLNIHVLQTFGFTDYDVYLSTRPKKYVGSDAHWQLSTKALEQALEKKGLAYALDPGEGVFYGPKIDIKIKDQLGRSWQCSTIQVDFNLPERFGMTYTGQDGAEHQPIMIHRALMGSLERFIGVLIEHYAGAFPLWLAPEQARVMNITDEQAEYCTQVVAELRRAGIRVEADLRNEKLNYKIREAQVMKTPYMLIVGNREMEEGMVTVRRRNGENLPPMSPQEFSAKVRRECEESAVY
jgi:threonyl-tRNA synthetase